MPNRIKTSDLKLTSEEINQLHFKLMNQQCPVHLQTPFVEIVKNDILYTCCCDRLKALCMLALRS